MNDMTRAANAADFADTHRLEPVNSDFQHPPFDACGDVAQFEGEPEPEGVPGWLAVVLVMMAATFGSAVTMWVVRP